MTRDFAIALLVMAGLCFLVVIASEHRSAAYAMPLVSTKCIELHPCTRTNCTRRIA